MHRRPTNEPSLNVASVLPADWDKVNDVLLIVGEDGGAISAPFVEYGLQRVIVMFPRPLVPEPVATGAQSITTRAELSRYLQLLKGEKAGRFALLRTPRCSIPVPDTDSIHALTASLLKRQKANEHIHAGLAPLWAANGLQNLAMLGSIPMVTDVGDALAGQPVIIVGAGPSLAKNIHTLRAAQDKAIIICVARALRSLHNAGIAPDFVISLDPYDVLSLFRDVDLKTIPSVLISATSNPNLFSLPETTLMSFSGNTEAEGWMFEPEDGLVEMPSGGSVSCTAMSVALQWGCSPIILVGQDLSFSGGNFYHADGADGDTTATFDSETKSWVLEGYSDDLAHTLRDRIDKVGLRFSATEVPGYFGGMVPTNPAFASFRTWFEFVAADHSGITPMYNCTEGGTHISGMQHVPLADAVAAIPRRSIEIEKLIQQLKVSPNLAKRERTMRAKKARIESSITEAIAIASDCIALIKRSKRNPAILGQLRPLEVRLSATMRQAFVLNLLAQGDIREALTEGQQAQTMAASLAATQKLYQVIVDHGSRLL